MLRCATVGSQALNIRDVLDREIEARCERCGGPLGRYSPIEDQSRRGGIILAEVWRDQLLVVDRWSRTDATVNRVVPGPRTQPGLYRESFNGRPYLRKRCICGANEKRRGEDVAGLAVMVRDDDTVVLVF